MSKVSVIIPAYNQGRFLANAIESVLDQTWQDFELVVVDDGSTDNSAEVANSILDQRVYYIYQDNLGLAGARNTGIRNSAGEYLVFLDSDDLLLPRNLELLGSELDRDPTLGLVAGQAVPINENGTQLGIIFDKGLPADRTRLLLGNPIQVGTMMVRRSWQEQVGYFDESLHSYEDWDMWLRLARAGCPMRWIGKPVFLYRFHDSQMTRIGPQMTEATFSVLDKHFADPDLPQEWRNYRDVAYSSAYLRAAAQAFSGQEYSLAQEYLNEAVKLNPKLISDDGELLVSKFAAWTRFPKGNDPLKFLEDIYNNLPNDLDVVRQRRRQDLGRAAMELAFNRFHDGDMKDTRTYVRRAVGYQPGWLTNRGVLSILFRSHIQIGK
jgi:glycosyltransferase involved in cell wall biosynthesis